MKKIIFILIAIILATIAGFSQDIRLEQDTIFQGVDTIYKAVFVPNQKEIHVKYVRVVDSNNVTHDVLVRSLIRTSDGKYILNGKQVDFMYYKDPKRYRRYRPRNKN